MINNLTISAMNHNLSIEVNGFHSSILENNLMINQIISSIASKIILAFKDPSSVQQVDFVFNENKSFKILIEKEGETAEYDLNKMDQDLKKRSDDLIDLVQEMGPFAKPFAQDVKSKDFLDNDTEIVTQNLNKDTQFNHLKPLMKQSSIISRIFHSIQRWIASRFTIEPALKKFKKSFFADVYKEKVLKEKWSSSEKAVHKLVDHLYEELNKGYGKEVFSREEWKGSIFKRRIDSNHFCGIGKSIFFTFSSHHRKDFIKTRNEYLKE